MIRLAIAVEKGKLATHYGHAETYDIYQIANDQYQFETSIVHDKKNHLQSYDDLASKNVNAIAFDMVGENGFEHLIGRGIDVYYGQKGDVEAFLEAFIKGQIKKPKVYVEDQSVCAL
jgi:predicted Fe-Mo cluster-binding NifX family protein